MDIKFEALLRSLAEIGSRRAMLGQGLALATIGRGLPIGGDAATCKGKTGRCGDDKECCSRRCKKRKGSDKGRCRCSPYGARCRAAEDCCEFAGNPDLHGCYDGRCGDG